jgi:DNA-binding IclR family transcriptional regulator
MMALCIHSVQPRRHIRLSYPLFTPQPLYAGASGKPLLAHAPPALLEEVIASGLTTFTPATPDAAHLRHQLAMIRSTGYCLTVGELDEHVAAIGVPVFMGRTLVAALSVAGPVDQFDPPKLSVVRDHLLTAGDRLRRILEQSPLRAESSWPPPPDHGARLALASRRPAAS